MLERNYDTMQNQNVILMPFWQNLPLELIKALSGPTGIQEKTNINKMQVSKLIKIVHFLGKHNLPIKELYSALLHSLAFDLEEQAVFGKLPKECNIRQQRHS